MFVNYTYDANGNLLKDDGSAIGALHDKKKSGAFRNSFTYNREQTDYSTNLQYFVDRNTGNSKPLISTNLQYFASETSYGKSSGYVAKLIRLSS